MNALLARNPNPWSKKLLAYHEEIVAVSLLLGVKTPIFCSCCFGTGRWTGIFGGWLTCAQCNGVGYDLIDPKVDEYFKQKNR